MRKLFSLWGKFMQYAIYVYYYTKSEWLINFKNESLCNLGSCLNKKIKESGSYLNFAF